MLLRCSSKIYRTVVATSSVKTNTYLDSATSKADRQVTHDSLDLDNITSSPSLGTGSTAPIAPQFLLHEFRIINQLDEMLLVFMLTQI